MIRIAFTTVFAVLLSGMLNADQDPKPATPTNAQPPQRLIIRAEDLSALTRPTKLGMITLMPPQTTGEVVRLSIPVGELTMRAAHAIADAHRRRQEEKVDQRIERELQQLISPGAAPMKR